MEIGKSLFTAGKAGPAAQPVARVLIVDDEPRIREAYGALLAAEGREILTCANGADAIARLGSTEIDVMVLDLHLPDMHGTEIMAQMAEAGIDTAVVVFSGDDAIDSAILALRRGACEFIRKHADPEDLIRTVDKAISRRRLERENARMTARLEDSERLHRFLVEYSPDIIYTLDPEGRFVFLNRRIESLLGYNRGELVGKHYSVIVHPMDLEQARSAFAERRVGLRATTNQEIRLRCRNLDVRSFENRTIVAILSSQGIYQHEVDDGDAKRFVGTAGVLRDITERKHAEETISYQTYHDLLTGLPNRVLFRDRLNLAISQARRRGEVVGLMYIDLDRFKLVNDTHGQLEGDELLKGFARRVRECLRAGDTMSRQSGDEFTILLPDIADAEAVRTIAEKITTALKTPFTVGGRDFRCTASIGIAVFPDDAETPDHLLRDADIAMCQVKAQGKNGFLRYTEEMSRNHSERVDLDNELRIAIESGQLTLHYQPQVDIRRGRVTGVEALVRWEHPERGMLGPNTFIPLAEEGGLIFAISDWVLNEACRQQAIWIKQGITDLKVAVNISPLEFTRADIVERILQPIRTHELAPECIEIEITENMLMDDAETVIAKVQELRTHGLRISIDDFGTRFSSLNYLRRFPVNTIKIDQSFVRDLETTSCQSPVISAIVGIARGFGLSVLAEGVETESQIDALRLHGCDVMQGFRFSRPVPPADVVRYIAAHQAMETT
ncbi:putative bifunctional diguanylate cyclase/phosphodiesterase [Aromatoleum petrolei]|uniref:EAL domain-containing protein n=1 Tax=Aromatoleum petrolei TaxID=76116 RepID=A0ABX1MNC8_9RHOO|nr:EAL domain-containing protein [Aromatoleum petrolei]NMF89283.1 EAL domain-containing protein [Aromatoleum petrolei]QTQ35113.1 Two component system response regulator, CheY-like [Aromatoleum petrolei]